MSLSLWEKLEDSSDTYAMTSKYDNDDSEDNNDDDDDGGS